MKYLLIPFFLLLCFVDTSKSQPTPAKYGKVDLAELQMTVYDLDTTADAVVLCDYGIFNSNTFEFTRFKRIKILKKTGYDRLNQTYYIPNAGMIRGCTYNLENGVVVESKLKPESIYKERLFDDYYRYKVAMPDIKVGSVIDITYSHPGLPSVWYFQDDIPVRWSELRIPSSRYVNFQKSFFGYEPLYFSEEGRWIGKDMPALHAESYVNSIDNYKSKFEFEVQSITFPGYYKFFTTSWESVNTYLLDHDDFGGAMTMITFLGPHLSALKEKNLQGVPLMKAACDLAKEHIKWNGTSSIYTSADLGYSFKKGSGNCADINLMLVALLNRLDFDAFPIVLSTRDNGMISIAYPTINKFNYVIAGVRYQGKIYYFDATDPDLPPGMLPFRALNGKGRMITKQGSDWVDMSPTADQKKVILCSLKMEENGKLSGTITYTESDYEAYYSRMAFRKYNSKEEYIKEVESKYPGLTIDSYNFENLDSIHKPLKKNYEVTITGNADMIGDMVSFRPMLIEQLESNPFKVDKRKYPIDYGHPIRTRYILSCVLPEGYEVAEMPKPCNIILPDKDAKYNYNITVNDNVLQLISNFEISRTIFLESDYNMIKEFYNQIIAKQSEVIILKKKVL